MRTLGQIITRRQCAAALAMLATAVIVVVLRPKSHKEKYMPLLNKDRLKALPLAFFSTFNLRWLARLR